MAEENQLLKDEIKSLKDNKQKNFKNEFFEIYDDASSFCNWKYLDYYLKDDFEDILKDVTKNLDGDAKKKFKLILLRVLMVNMIRQDSLYFDEELENQEKFIEFRKDNCKDNKIGKYNFTGNYNLHMFINLGFSDEEMDFIKNKDIIDAGAFTGDTALPLSEITEKNVYAFEPFIESFELLEKNIDDNNIENIIPINKSLGDINGERTLFLAGDNVQGITNDPNIRKHDKELKVDETTINKFVKDNDLNVGLISVDVEGAEMELLKGAIETIKAQKPILTISIYHKASDFFEIIPWIANLGLGYEFEIEKDHPWPFLA
ncbi:MAG: FkbM family methyltransferase, partial [Methanobrevibacter sp.]|nr:FkbM family methyltransferase [Methanobrevibacter sp.]